MRYLSLKIRVLTGFLQCHPHHRLALLPTIYSISILRQQIYRFGLNSSFRIYPTGLTVLVIPGDQVHDCRVAIEYTRKVDSLIENFASLAGWRAGLL